MEQYDDFQLPRGVAGHRVPRRIDCSVESGESTGLERLQTSPEALRGDHVLLWFDIRQDWVYQLPNGWRGEGHRPTNRERGTVAMVRLRVWLGKGANLTAIS